MANIKELIQSIESPDSSFDEKLAVINEMQDTLVAMKEHEAIDDNVELIIEALRTIEAKVEAKLRIIPEKGEQGIQGQKGEQGDRGLDGYQGKDGKSGADGKDGIDGKDGVSVQDAKIDFDGSLVITLSDGREINVGEVVPVDVAQTIHKIQSGSGGDSQTTLNAIAALQATIATYGTMAIQNANNVAITGGTINNTTVGATTPSTGTFTTLTAQTEVLKGTGQNLLLQSQTFSNAIWSKQSSVTVTSNTTVAPDSTTTASTITADADLGIYQSIASIIGLPYTQSVYVKAGTATAIMFRDDSGAGRHIVFNPSTGVITSTAGTLISSGSQSFGNGWYRYYFSYLADTTQVRGIVRPNSSGTAQTFFVWGAQTELASPAGTYTVTTTTAVYGTPTLSFSGVSTIGLQSDGSLFVQPAGTGALQAQATTSSATGGNARGINAVDWQTVRSAASQVASGTYAFIGSGRQNISSGQDSFVGAGFQNTSSSNQSGVVAGARNQATGGSNFIGSGNDNIANFAYGAVVGGQGNTASGYFGLVGNGFTNSTTSNTAVTTQSGTMNGTTAVTLSASNANIKVGQLITGTSITFPTTYVAAISGTSLTLSTAASGSSTSTLSFFTPHGVVVGGGNNQATGSYSFIGGGGDAGTAANRNVASGDWSAVVGGTKNTGGAPFSFIGGGYGHTTSTGYGSVVCGGGFYGNLPTQFSGNSATGSSAFVGAGFSNQATGFGSFVGSGNTNIANSIYSTVVGGINGTTRSIIGNQIFPANNSPIASASGVSQAALLILGRQTTDATATVLTSDTNAASGTNQVILPNNSAYTFRGEIVSGVTGGGNSKSWTIEGLIKRGANAAATTLVGSTVTSMYADVGAATWTIALSADTTNGGLAVTFTGQASTTIRTVCQIRTTEMTY